MTTNERITAKYRGIELSPLSQRLAGYAMAAYDKVAAEAKYPGTDEPIDGPPFVKGCEPRRVYDFMGSYPERTPDAPAVKLGRCECVEIHKTAGHFSTAKPNAAPFARCRNDAVRIVVVVSDERAYDAAIAWYNEASNDHARKGGTTTAQEVVEALDAVNGAGRRTALCASCCEYHERAK